MELHNSKREIRSACYVETRLTPDEQEHIESLPGSAQRKLMILRMLDLRVAEIDRIEGLIRHSGASDHRDDLAEILSAARALATGKPPLRDGAILASTAKISFSVFEKDFLPILLLIRPSLDVSGLLKWLKHTRKISPVGRLHLERIETYPIGVERGELVFTVPMAPHETVNISHKEWSTFDREFEQITDDYFETYSERGVAEKTDATTSSENEARHSSSLNFGTSASGEYVGVTLTSTLGIVNTSDEKQSIKRSAELHREISEKASARARKQHRVSVKLVEKTGVEDVSVKTFANDKDQPIRVDYYRLMRRWRNDLYRYDLRLTYDITIPIPGVRLWALHTRLAELDGELMRSFHFDVTIETITSGNYKKIAEDNGIAVAILPPPPIQFIFNRIVPDQVSNGSDIAQFGKIDFEVPGGYRLKSAKATSVYADAQTAGGAHFTWLDGGNQKVQGSTTVTGTLSDLIPPPGGVAPTGRLAARYSYHGIHSAGLTLDLNFERTSEGEFAWKQAVWGAMRASCEEKFQAERARTQEVRDTLWRSLNGRDTLSLRMLEREELVRLVTQWLFGATAQIVSGSYVASVPVQDTLQTILDNERKFQRGELNGALPTFNPTFNAIDDTAWCDAIIFGDEMVKFVHQAIEWENILYFLYPYFWGSETIGRDKLLFEHPDPEHQRFLRAGYARVVLTIRPGFEEDFTRQMEFGSLADISTHPYMTIAKEIANFARTNYHGVPPANPEQHARPLLHPEQRATWDTIEQTIEDLEEYRVSHNKYPEILGDLPSGHPEDAWGNPLLYRQPGLGAPFDLVSLGEDGKEGGHGLAADISSAASASLMATWNSYSPTNGLDIAVDTKLSDMA